MKILYGINGTGQGHVSRAKQLIPALKKQHEVDVLLSGQGNPLDLNFEVRYNFKGFTFFFKEEKISYWRTLYKNSILRFMKDCASLDISSYDLVISDFEPITSWTAKAKGKKCIHYSHQASFFSKKAPRPSKKDYLAEAFMRLYCPSNHIIASHYKKYEDWFFHPTMSEKVFNARVTDEGHIVVYMSNLSLEFLKRTLGKFHEQNFHVFSPKCLQEEIDGNIKFMPISSDGFLSSLVSCGGVICGAGFGLPGEAMFLKKKMLAIPIKNQYEQACNAASLKEMGVFTSNELTEEVVRDWLMSSSVVELERHTPIEQIVEKIEQCAKD